MLELTALKDMKVMIATPYYSGCGGFYTKAIFDISASAVKAGLQLKLSLLSESLITRARNRLVAIFLADESLTHLLFYDADLGVSTDMFFHIILSGLDVAAGVYPIKNYEWPEGGIPAGMTKKEFEARYLKYPMNPLEDGLMPVNEDGFGEVAEAPTGFMCIKREVFLKMMAAYPELQYTPEIEPESKLHWLFFDCMKDKESNRYLSEDFTFCHRWRAIGGKVHADIFSHFGHEGLHLYHGNWMEHLQAIGGNNPAAIAA